jgi:hypothetical protein
VLHIAVRPVDKATFEEIKIKADWVKIAPYRRGRLVPGTIGPGRCLGSVHEMQSTSWVFGEIIERMFSRGGLRYQEAFHLSGKLLAARTSDATCGDTIALGFG